MKTKDFHVLAPFTVKVATTPTHDPDMVSTGEAEIIKISGIANFSGDMSAGDVFVDLAGEVVSIPGMDVAVWKSNPQILWQHNRNLTIGRGLSITKKKDGLHIEAEIHAGAMEEEDFYRIKAGLVTRLSIGFRSKGGTMKKIGDKHVYIIEKSVLFEVSVVSLPCNTESAFRIIKSLPDDEGFYAGDLEDHEEAKNFSTDVENENHIQGENMLIKRRELLPADKVKELEALGLTEELDALKEVPFGDLKDLIKAEIKAELKAEAAAEAAALEAEEKAAAEALEAEKAALEAEEKAAAEALEAEKAAAEESDMAEQVKALQEVIESIKQGLGNE